MIDEGLFINKKYVLASLNRKLHGFWLVKNAYVVASVILGQQMETSDPKEKYPRTLLNQYIM